MGGDRLLAGSYCVAGEGAYEAALVGPAAFAQTTAREARQYRYAAGPIQHGIDKVVRLLSYTAILLSAGYLALYQVRVCRTLLYTCTVETGMRAPSFPREGFLRTPS